MKLARRSPPGLAALVLAGCSEAQNNGQNSLDPKGADAEKIHNLFTPVAIIAILVGIFIIRRDHLRRGAVPVPAEGKNENPKQVHGNTKLEIGWTIIPALLLAVIAVPTVGTIFDLAEAPPDDALQVTVVGKQWWWEFQYTDAKVVTANELIIPVDRPVALKLKACDQGHVQRDPQLLGARARRATRTSCPGAPTR